MKEATFTIEEAARCLPSLVQHVHATGEPALLVQAGEPMVRIVAIATSEPPMDDLIAFLRRWRLEHPEPDEQFGEDVTASRQGVQPPCDPWE